MTFRVRVGEQSFSMREHEAVAVAVVGGGATIWKQDLQSNADERVKIVKQKNELLEAQLNDLQIEIRRLNDMIAERDAFN
jgi:hypothetical protein